MNDWSWPIPATLGNPWNPGRPWSHTELHEFAGRFLRLPYLYSGTNDWASSRQQTGIPNALSSTEFHVVMVIEVAEANFLDCPTSSISKKRMAAHDVMMTRCISVKAMGSKRTTPFSGDFPFQIVSGIIPRVINWTEVVQCRREVANLARSMCCSDQVAACDVSNCQSWVAQHRIELKSRRE